jgi:hypothetical protein
MYEIDNANSAARNIANCAHFFTFRYPSFGLSQV